VSQQIKPEMLCRIVDFGAPWHSALVRTVQYWPAYEEWLCEALQHIECADRWNANAPVVAPPGSEVAFPARVLQPLYDGDAEDEMVSRMRKRTEEISQS
jgi:hypothetical protein